MEKENEFFKIASIPIHIVHIYYINLSEWWKPETETTRNKQQRKYHQSQRRETFSWRWKHRCWTPPLPIHTERNQSKRNVVYSNTGQTGEKLLVCCTTGSQSRLANDDGTWLCCRSLACLRGVTEGGGTPDVDADRPSLQLTLGSVNKRETKLLAVVDWSPASPAVRQQVNVQNVPGVG